MKNTALKEQFKSQQTELSTSRSTAPLNKTKLESLLKATDKKHISQVPLNLWNKSVIDVCYGQHWHSNSSNKSCILVLT